MKQPLDVSRFDTLDDAAAHATWSGYRVFRWRRHYYIIDLRGEVHPARRQEALDVLNQKAKG